MGRWGRGALIAAALAAISASTATAEAQQPAPNVYDAQVQGVVVDAAGQALAGVPITVTAYDDNPFGGVFALFTLGFACIVPEACFGTADDLGDTSTDAGGAYTATLPATYVPGTETDTDWVVAAGRAPAGTQLAGPTSSFEFEVNTAVQAAPPLPLWESEPGVTIDGWRATVTMPPVPAGLSNPTFTIGGYYQSIASTSPTATVDVRRFEGTEQTALAFVTAYADVRVPHSEGRTIYHQQVSTPTMSLGAYDLTPSSRGARCTVITVDLTYEALESCPVTDGERTFRLSDPRPPPATTTTDPATGAYPTPPSPAGVIVDLARPTEVADVFVLGCNLSCTVEASGDGVTWVPLTNDPTGSVTTTDGFTPTLLAAAARPAVTATQVRVVGLPISGVMEVSVWPAVPPQPIAPADPPPTTILADGTAVDAATGLPVPEPDRDDDSASPWAIGFALVALVVSVTSLVFVLRSVRPRGAP